MIDFTAKLGEINDIEHNKGSKIYPQNQVILDGMTRVSGGLKFTSDILSKQSKYCSEIFEFLGQFFRHSLYHHERKLRSALHIMKSWVVLPPFRTVGVAWLIGWLFI